jgi:hypothetical protein
MRVQSPVGTFPVRVVGARLEGTSPCVETTMGAWRSEVRFERSDAPFAVIALAILLLAFLAGRQSAPSRPRSC